MWNLPQIAILAAIVSRLYAKPKPQPKKQCQSAYCNATELWVDRPMNTLLKDQSLGVGLSAPMHLPGTQRVAAKIKSDYRRETVMSPGVALVAHGIAVA